MLGGQAKDPAVPRMLERLRGMRDECTGPAPAERRPTDEGQYRFRDDLSLRVDSIPESIARWQIILQIPDKAPLSCFNLKGMRCVG
jgi:hypothetical protein